MRIIDILWNIKIERMAYISVAECSIYTISSYSPIREAWLNIHDKIVVGSKHGKSTYRADTNPIKLWEDVVYDEKINDYI